MPSQISFKDLPLWQRSMGFVVDIYQLSSQLPASNERVTLTNSLQTASLAIPTLIATGSRRGRDGFRDACLSGRENCAEVETLLILVKNLYAGAPVDDLLAEIADIDSKLASMAKRLQNIAPKKSV